MKATKLTNQIQKQLRYFNPTVTVKVDTEFSYYYDTDIITYCPYQFYPEQAEEFAGFVEKTYNFDIRPHYFMFSLLHEIGHSMTMDLLGANELQTEAFLRELIHASDEKLGNEMYFNLPSERMANKWAVEYFNDHRKMCLRIEKRLQKMLNHYYKKA